MFDELITPPPSVDPPAPEVIALIAEVIPPVQAESTGSPSSTTIDQKAPSPSKSQTTPETQSPVIPQDVEEDIYDIEVARMGNRSSQTTDMTIHQQVALDEALIPHASRLRIGKSNFRHKSDISSKESTLQLVWNPTSTSEPIISDSSPSPTPFEGSDFILEDIEAYLKDETISPEIDHADCDLEGNISLIEKLLNDDPFQLPLMDLKQGELAKAKSLTEEPLELELKDLPSHLEYAYLEGIDKLPVIISKDLKDDEKEALLNVLKSSLCTLERRNNRS
nr:reverse transcriptase domain-containing protein [Tanacetum cinerariifolium]